ncbi:MAG: YjjG family noncanonical pyrimidine nucleotidase [Chloroflexota bacterium]
MYQWLLFDADNTLFDFSLAEEKAFQATFAAQNLPFSDKTFQQYKQINKIVWEQFEQGLLTPDEVKVTRFERLFEALHIEQDSKRFSTAYTDQLSLRDDLLDGVEALLATLAPTYKMGLITNGLKKVQRSRLARSSIQSYFDPVIISEEVGSKKPETKIFDVAFTAMGNPAKASVLIIGDSLSSDILGGINYGIDTCWYNPSRKPNSDRLPLTYEIQSLDQLPQLLAEKKGN